MSLWTAQTARIQKQTAFFAALRAGECAGVTEETDVLLAMESENAELELLTESTENLALRQSILESHGRELAGLLGRHQVQALEDLQFQGVEFDAFGVLRGTLFGSSLLLTP